MRSLGGRGSPRRRRLGVGMGGVIVIVLLTLGARQRNANRNEQNQAASVPTQVVGTAQTASVANAPIQTGAGQSDPISAHTVENAAADPATQVRAFTVIKTSGGRLDWSPDGKTIVFDKIDPTGHYSIYTMKPDGSGETCLTCGKPGLSRHDGNPAYHPSGQYIAFQAEKENHPGFSTFATPGQGVHNDIWVMTADGKSIFQLTDLPRGQGVLHPHFSHDGSQLMWAEKMAPADDPAWALKVANFTVSGGTPSLANIRTYQPLGNVFYESHGFSLDGRRIIFSAFLKPDQATKAWMDIYTLDLNTNQLQNLTNTPADWDEHANYTVNGKKIVWISSKGCNCDPSRTRDLQTDLWIMNSDGTNKQQITNLSDRRSFEFIKARTIAADSAWNPDGTRLALYVITDNGPPATGEIAILDFANAQ